MPFNRVWSPTNSNDPAFQPIAKPKSGMFGGNSRRIAGIIGDALGGLAGQPPLYAQQQYAQRHENEMLQRQMALAQWKMQNPEPTGTMQNIAATGVQPGTPEYQQRMLKAIMQPHYVMFGNPEQGQTLIDANNPPAPDGPPPEAVAHLKQDPSLSAQFDEVFGQGAAARAMGSQ